MKKKYKLLIIISSCLVIIMVILMMVLNVFNIKTTIYELIFPQDLQLTTTNTDTKIKEGIYITDVSEVVEETMPVVVAITSTTLIQSGYYGPFGNQQYTSEGAGSGIIISNSNDKILILTNNHVVSGTTSLSVQFIDGKEAEATIVGSSEEKDIAVISVKVSDLDESTLKQIKIATLGDSTKMKVGNGVIAIGNALGYGQSVTTGVVSALDRVIASDTYSNKMIQTDAAINGGNSGGALLNENGEVIGINSSKYSSSGSNDSASIEGMGFAIPISDVKDLIIQLMNGKITSSSGITLGITGYMTNSEITSGYNMPQGFYISGITEGSYADKNNLEIGYIITTIDGKEVSSVSDIKTVLSGKKEGDSVKLKVKYPQGRSYVEKEIEINF